MENSDGKVLTLNFGGDTIKSDKTDSESPPVTKTASKDDIAKAKILNARIQGRREYDDIKGKFDSLVKLMKESAAFSDSGFAIEHALSPYFSIIDSVIKGQRPMGISEDDFKQAQKEVLKSLLKKYCIDKK